LLVETARPRAPPSSAKTKTAAETSSRWDDNRRGPAFLPGLSSEADDVAGAPLRESVFRQMSDLIAIGYPDETTALKAEKEAQRLAGELIIQPDAIAAIVRDKDGKFKVTTNHHMVSGGASYGMFWGLLFGLLF